MEARTELLDEAYNDGKRDGSELGLKLGARIEHDRAVAAIAQAALAILGKDRSDGPVDLGALGVHTANDC